MVLVGRTGGTVVLHELMTAAVAAYPDAFEGLSLPASPEGLKARYPELLPEFEAARVQSAERSEIARTLCLAAGKRLAYLDEAGERPLAELLAEPHEPLHLVRVDLPGPRRLTPSVEFEKRLYVGGELLKLASELDRRRLMTQAAARALAFVTEMAGTARGLSLSGERFVLLGAGAQLSPVYTLLEAGAEVLWLDLDSPPIDRVLEPRLGGVLHYAERGADLLADPGSIRATILEYAQGAPIHLGLYTFASGDAYALRLALTMNEIVRSLPPELLKSVAFSLSPTSPSPISREDAEQADERQKSASKVWRALLRAGPLQRGHVMAGEARISRMIVPQQGAAFQVAEYIGKRLAAEAFSEYGSALAAPADERALAAAAANEHGSAPAASAANEAGGAAHGARRLAVSADMAPVTATRSLSSPMLEAAIVGAGSFEMLIAQPATARAVAALLLIHDLLQPELAASTLAERARDQRMDALFARQFHGGVHAQPYALQGIIRMAAIRGFAHRPKLALELFR